MAEDIASLRESLEVYPVLVEVGGDDAALAEALIRLGYLVRAGSEFGLDGFVRITVGPPPVMEGVARALAEARVRIGT